MDTLYNVHYTRSDTKQPSIGVVRYFGPILKPSKEEKAVLKRKNLIVDDCLTPHSFEVNPARVKEASFEEAEQFVEKAYKKAYKAAPKTFGVGSLFSLPVGDGKAFYMVTAINRSHGECTVEWRGYGGGDRWTDHHFQWGGTFDLQDVKRYVTRDQFLSKLFGLRKITTPKSRIK
jgi:hypothetical protein